MANMMERSWFDSCYGTPDGIADWHVHDFTFIDDYRFITLAGEVLKDDPIKDKRIAAVNRKFLDAGWEGDGEIGMIWIPPFSLTTDHHSNGAYIWHVKQSNNGVSWLMSETAWVEDRDSSGVEFLRPKHYRER